MPRWTMKSSPPSLPSRMNLPRRSTLATLWPATTWVKTCAGGVRSTSLRDSRTSSMRRPTSAERRSRATVSTSGSSGTDLLGGLAGRHGRHLAPVIANLDVNFQGHGQLDGAGHRLAHEWHERVDLLQRSLEEQLVMHLEQHA